MLDTLAIRLVGSRQTVTNVTSAPIDRTLPSQAKIALFRSLFRGREDVYPRRFESRKTGKSGYAPACANEWVQGKKQRQAVTDRLAAIPRP